MLQKVNTIRPGIYLCTDIVTPCRCQSITKNSIAHLEHFRGPRDSPTQLNGSTHLCFSCQSLASTASASVFAMLGNQQAPPYWAVRSGEEFFHTWLTSRAFKCSLYNGCVRNLKPYVTSKKPFFCFLLIASDVF